MSVVPNLLKRLPTICLLAAGSMGLSGSVSPRPQLEAVATGTGRIIVLPGIRNTRFHLQGFRRMAAMQLPGFEIEIRTWGPPLLGLHNLRARERNLATADRLAREIAAWRRAHPGEPLYLVGYSGGGGVAALTVAALPDGVTVDRLVLVAPAVSERRVPLRALLPHVGQFVVNYSSRKDLQVGLGTRLFGTIDGTRAPSVGHAGFTVEHAALAQWRWSERDRGIGHRGNHVAYLGSRWQAQFLLPALDPRLDAGGLRATWRARRAALGAAGS